MSLFQHAKTFPKRSVFISYNHETASDIAGRIYDRLCHRLSPEAVFKDNEEPELGVDFRVSFKAALAECRVMLVVIDPGWYERRNAPRPLGDDVPPDWVRMEVEYGLEKEGLKVIPVLVNGAPNPENQPLPPTLGPLRLRYYKRIHSDDGFKTSVDALIAAMEKHLVPPPAPPRRKLIPLGLTALVLAAAAFVGTRTNWREWLHPSETPVAHGTVTADPVHVPTPGSLGKVPPVPAPIAAKVEILDVDGKPLSGRIPAFRSSSLAAENKELWENGFTFDFKLRKVGDSPLGSFVNLEIYYKADDSGKPPPGTGGMILDPEFEKKRVGGFATTVPATGSGDFTHKWLFKILQVPPDGGGLSKTITANGYVGKNGFIPDGPLKLGLKIRDAQNNLLAEQDVTLDVEPSFKLLDKNGTALGQRALNARRVTDGDFGYDGSMHPCKNGLEFELMMEGPQASLAAPLEVSYYLKSADSVAQPATLFVGPSMHMIPAADPAIKSKGYTLTSDWAILPAGAPAVTGHRVPFTPRLFAGAEGRIPVGDHDVAIVVKSGTTTVYSGEIKLNVWELEPQDEKVEVLAESDKTVAPPDKKEVKSIRDPGNVIHGERRDNLQSKDGLHGIGFAFGLIIKNTGDKPFKKLSGHIYVHASGSTDEGPDKDCKLITSPSSEFKPVPMDGGYNLDAYAWDLTPGDGPLLPGKSTTTWGFYVNIGAGGKVLAGIHEIGIEVLDGTKPIYRGRMNVKVD